MESQGANICSIEIKGTGKAPWPLRSGVAAFRQQECREGEKATQSGVACSVRVPRPALCAAFLGFREMGEGRICEEAFLPCDVRIPGNIATNEDKGVGGGPGSPCLARRFGKHAVFAEGLPKDIR